MTRPMASPWRCTAIVAAALSLCWLPDIRAQAQELPPPPQGVSRGENFSAKPPAQLFASDCTGAGCHKGPQGLGRKSVGIGGLQGFLREHYTNSRESAAALANYLSKLPSGPEPKEARSPKSGKPAAAAAAPASGSSNWFESTSTEGKPGSPEPRKPREAAHTPPGRGSHTAAKPEPGAKPEGSAKPEEPPAEVAHQHPAAEPAEAEKPEPAAKPAEPPARNARGGRGRHPVAAANAPAAAPAAAAEPEPAPPAPPPAAPKPKQYDIFD